MVERSGFAGLTSWAAGGGTDDLGCWRWNGRAGGWRRNEQAGGWRRRGAGLLVLEAENQNGEREGRQKLKWANGKGKGNVKLGIYS